MPPEFSLLSGESPAQRYLSGGVQPIGEARDPYDGVSAPERYVLNTVARHSSGVQTRKYLMASANQGIEVDAAIEAEQQAKAEMQGQTLVKNLAELQQRLPKEDFERALAEVYERLQAVPERPAQAELRDPSGLSLGLAGVASVFAAPRDKFDVLSVPFESQLADQQRRQAEQTEDWAASVEAQLRTAKTAGDVLEILSRREEFEASATLQQQRAWEAAYNNPSASLEQRRNAWQVLRDSFGVEVPEPTQKTSLEVQREASAQRSLASAKYDAVRMQDLEATRPGRLANLWGDADLKARYGMLADSRRALVDEQVENYQEELDIKWANVNSRYSLAMAQLEALESYRAATLAQGETRLALDYMRQMQDITGRVDTLANKDLDDARDAERELKREYDDAVIQERTVASAGNKKEAEAWAARIVATAARLAQARKHKRELEARIREAQADMQSKFRPMPVGPAQLTPGIPNPQATGQMPPPLPNQ